MSEGKTYNFYNGSQNVEHIEHQVNNYNYYGSQRQESNEEEGEMVEEDHLIRFIFNDSEREKVSKGLRECKDTGQVGAFCKLLWEEESMRYETLRSTGFHRAILSILNFETTETAIKQAIFKQVR